MLLDNKIAELTSNLATLQQDSERMEQNVLKITNKIKNYTYKLEADFTSVIIVLGQQFRYLLGI